MVARLAPQPLAGRPRVSVTIPSYGYGRYLRGCVASVLNQDGVDVEAIIVDNASTDDTVQIAYELAGQDPRVRVIARTRNLGHVSAFNVGLTEATGTYSVMLSADDLLTPGSLARSTALMEAHPEVGLVYGFVPYLVDETPRPQTRVRSWRIWSGDEWLEQICRHGRNIVFSPSAILRTEVFRAVGGYEQAAPHTCDLLLWMSAATQAPVGYVSGPDQAFYRLHGDSMSQSQFGDMLTDLTERHRAFELLFSRYGRDLPHTAELRTKANMALSREAVRHACRSYDRGRWDFDEPDKLGELAESLDPTIRDTPLWRSYVRRARRQHTGRRRTPRQAMSAAIDQARMRLGRHRQLGLRRWFHFGSPV
jgi:hypothetical protein